ncbi:MAG: flavodoxin family protein [Planctomycetota bacterium]
MNIIAISTSSRKNGNTSRLLQVMLSKLSSLGVQTEFIWTGDKTIQYCKACEHCMREDNCIIKDDYEEIRQKILKADGIIIGSPNYAFQMSANLKSLYERSHSLLYYTRRLIGKYAVGVSVGGHPYMTAKIAKTIAQGIWLCGGYYVGYLAATSVNRDEAQIKNESQIIQQAEQLAEKLYSSITNRKIFWKQYLIRKYFLYPQVATMVEKNKSKYPFLQNYYLSKKYL